MTDSYQSMFLDDPEFQSLLVGCLESLQRGETIDREALARDFPRYADEIHQFLNDRQLLEQVASDFGDVEPSNVAVSAYEKTIATTFDVNDLAAGDTVRYIGEYEILEEIARGGMGVVFKARQQKLKRVVALKMILAGKLADSSDVERFQLEARAAGRLKHSSIVPVREIGQHDGRHYFTMDFVEGRSLAEVVREETLAPKAAARLVQKTAEAVQYAHEHGTVHRDLKPANILIGRQGEPQVTDFGLAKMLESVDEESRAELTASGQILGTPSYMSPEQAAGKQDLVGTASDIYSLGAILYACLAGRAPFVADSPVDTLLQVMKKEPVSPRELNPSVPKDLETICLKCLTKEPHKRYGTAQELADDLNRFLEGHPVVARPVGPISRYYRWCQRNPSIAALSVLLFASMAMGTTIASKFAVDATQHARQELLQRQQAEAAQHAAEEQRARAEESRQEAERQEKAATVARAQAEWSFSQEADARMQAERARRDAVRSLYVARTHLTRLLWEKGNAWGASLPHVDRFFNDDLTIATPDPDLELETLDKMIAANPGDDFLHFLRGIYYAKRRQWRNAMADFELCSNLTRQQYWYHCEAASVALMIDDEEVYGRHLHSLLKYLTDFEERGEILSGANIALIAALRPQPAEVLTQLLPFAEEWASSGAGLFFRMKCLILVRMRLGEYDTVLELLEPFAEEASFKRTEHVALADSIRALALHHLDRSDEARRALESAEKTYLDRLKMDFVVREGSLQATSHPFIQAHVMLNEARKLVKDEPTAGSAGAVEKSGGPPKVDHSLLDDLSSDDSAERAAALRKLTELDQAAAVAVPRLLPLLRRPDSFEKILAIRCLARIGPAAALAAPALHDILKSEASLAGPRVEAGQALARIGPAGEIAIPTLIERLKNPGDPVKIYFATRPGQENKGLTAQLSRTDEKGTYTQIRDIVLMQTISTLEKFGSAAHDAIPAIEKVIDDPDTLEGVRVVAVQALKSIRSPAIEKPSADVEKDETSQVAPEPPDQPLPTTATHPPAQGHEPLNKVSKQQAQRDRSLVDTRALVKLLDSRDARQRARSLKLLARRGPEAVEALPQLLDILQQEDSYDKTLALRCLTRIGPAAEEAVPQLLSLLKDKDKQFVFRMEALRALNRIGPASEVVIPTLLDLLKNPGAVEKSYPKATGSPAAAGLMVPMLHKGDDGRWYFDRRDENILLAIGGLGASGTAAAQAIPELQKVRDDPDMLPLVRQAAKQALARISARPDPLDGKWQIQQAFKNGRELTEASFNRGEVEFSNSRYSSSLRANPVPYELDPTTAPAAIDLLITHNGKTTRGLGIYKIEGDTLTLVMHEPPTSFRPQTFQKDIPPEAKAKQAGRRVLVLKRRP